MVFSRKRDDNLALDVGVVPEMREDIFQKRNVLRKLESLLPAGRFWATRLDLHFDQVSGHFPLFGRSTAIAEPRCEQAWARFKGSPNAVKFIIITYGAERRLS